MIIQASINEVMNRADIIDVVGQFIKLKKRGANYIANCPFHNEKTPSFHVSASKGIFKCFGCGKAGNVVTFLEEHEKLTYPEAIHWLADYYKITLEETERSSEYQQQQIAGESLRILNEFAANYFHETLLNTEDGKTIGMSYFKQRGFRQDIIERFRLGYDPEYNEAFYRVATKKGYDTEILERAGLIKNYNGVFHDVYRGRVIFPIQNMTGKILGFGARILKTNDRAPKYINTPENELYNKSKTLYGMFQARQAIGKSDECFLVEGYTDVISLHQGGVENVVASSGTSLTEDQLAMIGRLTRNLTILYDGDAAGIKAALRGLDMALSHSFNVQLVLLPEGEDPDSYIQKSGAAKFHEYVKGHKQDVIGFKLEVGLKEVGTDPVKKSKLVNEIAESISKINKTEDFSLQSHYIKTAANKLNVEEAGLINLINKYIHDRIEKDGQREHNLREEVIQQPENIPSILDAGFQPKKKEEEQEWQLLKVLIEYGHMQYEDSKTVATYIDNKIDPSLLEIPLVTKLYKEYYDHLHRFGATPELHYFINHPEVEIRNKLASVLHNDVEVSKGWQEKLGILVRQGAATYLDNVNSSIEYFELRKVLWMQKEIIERIRLVEQLKDESNPEKIRNIQERLIQFRRDENELEKSLNPVVYKSNKVN